MARGHRADPLEPAQALDRVHRAALGLVDDVVERRDLIEPERPGELRDRLDRRRARRAERDDERGGQDDDARVARVVRRGDALQTLLRLAHRGAGEAQRAAELEDERVELALVAQATIRISREVLFRRRPPSSVHVTMSSMRTPKRPDR